MFTKSFIMKQILLLVFNTVTFVFTLLMNYLANNSGLTPATVGEVSARYENLFTPAGYAFAIWGVIYLMLVAFLIYLWYDWYRNRNDEYLTRTGIWFMVGNLANGLWILAWTNDLIGLSLALILVLLITLVVLMYRLRLEVWDAPVRIIAFVWWPFCLYLGWVVTATLANTASWTVCMSNEEAIALQQGWVVAMIMLAFVVYVALIYFRNMREAAVVGIWALVAIAVKQWAVAGLVAYSALAASAILLVYFIWQGYQNRLYSPFKKIQRGEI